MRIAQHISFAYRILLHRKVMSVNQSHRPAAAALSTVTQAGRTSQGELVETALSNHESELKASGWLNVVDIGANICDKSFDKDRQAVLERASLYGVTSLIITGTCLRSSTAAQTLVHSSSSVVNTTTPSLYYTAGCHPHNAKHYDTATADFIQSAAASDPHCVAIGECGLDFNRNFSPPDVQEKVFALQIDLAEELQKPLFMHNRDASHRFYDILQQHRKTVPGILHCFTGSKEELQTALEVGLHIGITGWVCDDRPERGGRELGELLPLIPDDRLMIETDCPYLTPRTIGGTNKDRPKRNEPALLQFVLKTVAEARGQTMQHVAEITTANAKRLFGL